MDWLKMVLDFGQVLNITPREKRVIGQANDVLADLQKSGPYKVKDISLDKTVPEWPVITIKLKEA